MHLQTFGDLALFRSQADVRSSEPILSEVKPLVIVAYLALTPGRRARRDHVADLLWPGNGHGGARRSLRQALYTLSQRVSPSLVETDGAHLKLADVTTCDAWALQDAEAARDYERVVELSARPFLENMARGLGAELQEWVEINDRRRRVSRRDALCSLIEGCVKDERLDEAERYARTWIVDEPLAEEPRKVLIRILTASGDEAGAYEAYEEYRALLYSALEDEPSTELTQSVDEVRRVLLEDHEWKPLARSDAPLLTRRSARKYAAAIFVAGILVGAASLVAIGLSSLRSGGARESVQTSFLGGGELFLRKGDTITIYRPASDSERWTERRPTEASLIKPSIELRGPYRTTRGLVWTDRYRESADPPYPFWLRSNGDSVTVLRGEGDVGQAIPSPDGRWFVVSAQRAAAVPFAKDLWVVSAARITGDSTAPTPRLIYSAPGQIGAYAWAPDGLAIAAAVRDSVDRLVVLRPLGQLVREYHFRDVLSLCWLGGSTRLGALVRDSDGARVLVIDLEAETVRTVHEAALGEVLACSPDGRGVAYAIAREGVPRLEVRDLDSGGRYLAPIDPFFPRGRIEWVPDAITDVPLGLEIVGQGDTLAWGDRVVLRADLAGIDHDRFAAGVTWESRDPWIASVSADGTLFGNRPGETAIVASLYGWVSDTFQVSVTGSAPEDLVIQDVLATVDSAAWTVVATPPPEAVRTRDGMATWLRGDGRYSDGFISQREFSLASGARLEFELRFQPTRPTGERLAACLQLQGDLPDPAQNSMGSSVEAACVRYPSEELQKFDPELAVLESSSGVRTEFEMPSADSIGWRRIAIEVRADGIVSVEIDGRRMASGSVGLVGRDSNKWRVSIRGASTEPTLLIRNLSLWLGPRVADRVAPH